MWHTHTHTLTQPHTQIKLFFNLPTPLQCDSFLSLLFPLSEVFSLVKFPLWAPPLIKPHPLLPILYSLSDFSYPQCSTSALLKGLEMHLKKHKRGYSKREGRKHAGGHLICFLPQSQDSRSNKFSTNSDLGKIQGIMSDLKGRRGPGFESERSKGWGERCTVFLTIMALSYNPKITSPDISSTLRGR